MKKIFKMSRGIILISFLLVSCERSQDQNTQEMNERTAVPVEVVKVELNTLRHILSYTGLVEAWEELSIVPNISGKIARIYVKEGDRVKKGQILAELDTDPAKLSLAQAKANIQAAEAAFTDAEKNWNRMKELIKDSTISPMQYEKAELGYNSAKAGLEQARVGVDLAEYNLRVSIMKAPFDGVITKKFKNEGDTINPMMPGGGGVVTLMDFSKVKVKILAPDTDLQHLKEGLKVNAKVDAYSGVFFKGSVYIVNPAAASQSRLFEIQLKIPNPELKLKPGMFARIEVITEERKDVSSLPATCIISAESNQFVFVVSGEKAEHREVITGITESELVEIVSGVQLGDRVVSVGQTMLEDGTPVVIKGGETQ